MKSQGLGSEIKNQFRIGTMTNRLIIINLFVFLFIICFIQIVQLSEATNSISASLPNTMFILDTNISSFLSKPWGLITNIFAHFDFLHLFKNMLFLYFVGHIFEKLFGSNKLFWIYFLGGISGGVFVLLAHNLFPALKSINSLVLGASGAVMAILSAIAFYNPKLRVTLFGQFQIKIIFIALFFWILDLTNLSNGINDKIAHFAHIGGIFFGYFAVRNINSKNNILSNSENFWQKLKSLFKRDRNLKSRTSSVKSDEDYAFEKTNNQKKTDKILDKISKSGYESLSKEEKDFLYNQSKKL